MILLFPMTLLLLFRGSGEAGPAPSEPTSFGGVVGLRPYMEGNTGQKPLLEGRADSKSQSSGDSGSRG